jgi:polysaccharide export outer membrane protein
MATMCRVIMATRKSKITFNRGLLLFLGVALQPAMMAVQGNAQATAGAATSLAPTTGLSNSSGRAGAAAQTGGPTIVPKDISELRIVSGDLLSVSVYDNPELTGSYRVDLEGYLTLPLCGKVNLRGLTIPEAAKRIETAFKDGQILNQPQVNIDVVQYAGQYVTVMGEVSIPGRVALIAPTRLGEVLALAGGVTQLAGTRIKIRHGAVNRPGGYVMQEDGKLNVAEALAMSGGTLLQANTNGLRVIRRNPDGTVLDFPLSYEAIAKGTQTPLPLQAQDIVYVPMSKVKAIFTSTQTILGQAAASAIVVH